MRDLVYSVSVLCKHNKDGSFGTAAERQKSLKAAMQSLSDAGYGIRDVKQLKGKHIRYLVEKWKSDPNISTGTIKNRMSHLRWLAERIGNPRIVERSNSSYHIENRKYVDNHSNKAKSLLESNLERLTDDFVRYSLRLQQAFGLRREEAIKFQPKFADRETEIVLKGSWCKGGRERMIPITTPEQRRLLDEIHVFCRENNTQSLIPRHKTYEQQMRTYEYQTAKVGEVKNHGLRHRYAQKRYEELSGLLSPKKGGKTSRRLSESEKQANQEARLQVSSELGHNREEITAVYLGR
ncbi:integrase [Rodentibacter rarus]|uniref:Integrase n=1 Tax=Rodentibacter rarus TaxID=1908260 RepID=A0A1V3IKV4_9PAST|nr:phage integrase N-terminal domain-containing protein [Rodentibacter rarus]OOF41667.1 integrase [Rodentibacter rarus]OOF41949.1 integrase [Rodentibacter rarus]